MRFSPLWPSFFIYCSSTWNCLLDKTKAFGIFLKETLKPKSKLADDNPGSFYILGPPTLNELQASLLIEKWCHFLLNMLKWCHLQHTSLVVLVSFENQVMQLLCPKIWRSNSISVISSIFQMYGLGTIQLFLTLLNMSSLIL